MKHLPYFIFESLFDTDLTTIGSNKVADDILFNDPTSDVWKFLQTRNHAIPKCDINGLNLDFNLPVTIDNINGILKNPLARKYNLNVPSLRIESTGTEKIDNNLGFESINIGGELKIYIHNGKLDISNCTFNISDGVPRIQGIDWIKFDNVNIHFVDDNKFTYMTFSDVWSDIHIKGLTSNVHVLSFYGANIFEGSMKEKFNSFFGGGQLILNDGTKKTKSIRNICAVVNNMKKYGTIDPSNYTPAKKMADLIDINLKDFKNLEQIRISNNNIIMTLVNTKSTSVANSNAIQKYARYVRFNNMKAYKNKDLGGMVELVNQCKTSDGWVVLLEKKYY